MRIVLHVGLHKTGTSALQYFLSANSPLLLDLGIYYKPIGPKQTNHTVLATAMHKGRPELHASARTMWKNLLDAAQQVGADRLLLSSEEFTPQRLDMALAKDLICDHSVTAIAYLRAADELVASAHNQVVRSPKVRSTAPANQKPFAYPPLDTVLQPWMDLLGQERLVLAPYDPGQFIGGTIFSDFLSMLSITNLDRFDFDVPDDQANRSLSAGLIELLRITNSLQRSDTEHNALVGRLQSFEKHYQALITQTSRNLLTLEERRASAAKN